MRLLFAALLAASAPPEGQPADAGAAAAPQAPAPPLRAAPAWPENFDELWKRRDQPSAGKDLHRLLDQQLAADNRSFEANWRLAALLNWEADGEEGDKKADLGRQAWEAGDKAILARPSDVRGHYNAGVGVGLYSEGIGILTALSQGIEGKFRERMMGALRIDKDFQDGAPQVVWGRYYFKLPWPKRDVDKSVEVLMEAVRTHPDNVRAKLYLADSLADQGKGDEARRFAQDVIDARTSRDPPEDRRVKDMAKKWLASH